MRSVCNLICISAAYGLDSERSNSNQNPFTQRRHLGATKINLISFACGLIDLPQKLQSCCMLACNVKVKWLKSTRCIFILAGGPL